MIQIPQQQHIVALPQCIYIIYASQKAAQLRDTCSARGAILNLYSNKQDICVCVCTSYIYIYLNKQTKAKQII